MYAGQEKHFSGGYASTTQTSSKAAKKQNQVLVLQRGVTVH